MEINIKKKYVKLNSFEIFHIILSCHLKKLFILKINYFLNANMLVLGIDPEMEALL